MRRLARNTQKSYRDTFVLLLPLVGKKARKTLERLHVEDITAARVLAFLDHLENDRNCSVQTRNQRLTAIRSFARFVASRDPARLAWCSQVRAISAKKVVPQPVSWMSREEIDALLRVPDRTTPRGTGRTRIAAVPRQHGSPGLGSHRTQDPGSRIRPFHRQACHRHHPWQGWKDPQVPLWPRTETVLAELVKGRADDAAMFLSRHRRPYTRFGVYRLVERCAAAVPELAGKTITPHVVPHTSACLLLQAGVDINTIRAWLGHVSLATTNVGCTLGME